MNIQIYGKKKSFDTKKAERFFKERRVKYQYIDLAEFGLAPRVFDLFRRKLGLSAMVDTGVKEYETLFVAYQRTEEGVAEKLQSCNALYAAPFVRNGNEVTVGYCPDVWEKWE